MITLRFYRGSVYKPNREMKGAFTKTFESIEAAAKYLAAIRKSDVWVDPECYKKISIQDKLVLVNKFEVLSWGKKLT